MSTFTYTNQLTVIECCNCHMDFAMPVDFNSKALADHSIWFYCPLGHAQRYTGPTEAQRLKRQLDSAQQAAERERARADFWWEEQARTERSKRALKGQITKMRNRIAAGCCPVPGCKRTGLTQTMRHIATKHPQWHAEHAEELA